MQLCVDLINAVVEDIRDAEIAIHLCSGNSDRSWGAEGGYEPILPFLQRLNVDHYVMEFAIPAAGHVSALDELPERCMVGLGCVDCRSEYIDTPDEIAGRVRSALEYIDADRILLNPDCGFAPGMGFAIPLDEAYQKLRNEAEAAKILRSEIKASERE